MKFPPKFMVRKAGENEYSLHDISIAVNEILEFVLGWGKPFLSFLS